MPGKEEEDHHRAEAKDRSDTARDSSSHKSKGVDDDDDDNARDAKGDSSSLPPPRVLVTRIEVLPEGMCGVEEGLSLAMDFHLDRPLQVAHWEIKLVVDSVRTRQVLELGVTEEEDYPEGASSMDFSVDRIDVSGVKAGALANCGLLVASLRTAASGAVVVDVNMVVMVSEVDGALVRRVYSPLE